MNSRPSSLMVTLAAASLGAFAVFAPRLASHAADGEEPVPVKQPSPPAPAAPFAPPLTIAAPAAGAKARPPIDLAAPAATNTATFALG
jgi:hypothetical protein